MADPSDANPHAAAERQKEQGKYWRSNDLEMLDAFNREMASNPRVESWLVPLWDGVMVGRLVD